ncbi:hypothetical protein DIPPA_32164 [Diplonema papillatum]|nr:hypothetical protein DIPPA_32164 [Diplonema papillatum]
MHPLSAATVLSLSGLCAASALRTCVAGGKFETTDCQDYAVEVIRAAAIVPMILFCLTGVLLWVRCFRTCCNCCGGKYPRKGCCCVSDEPQVYSSCEVTTFRLLLIVILVAGVAACFPALTKNDELTEGVKSTCEVALSFVASVKDALDTITSQLDVLPGITAADKSAVYDIVDETKYTLSEVDDFVADYAYKYDHEDFLSRKTVVLLLGALGILMLLLVALIGLFKVTPNCFVTVVASVLHFGILLFAFLIFIHGVLHKTTDDVCSDYPYVATQLMIELEDAVGCPGTTTTDGVGEMLAYIADGKAEYVRRVCDALGNICGTAFDCPAAGPCNGGDGYDFADAIRNSSVIESFRLARPNVFAGCTVACSISDCATGCEVGSPERQASEGLASEEAVSASIRLLDHVVVPVAACVTLKNFVAQVQWPLCNEVSPSVFGLWLAFAVVGVMLFLGLFLITLAPKRFYNKRKVAPDSETPGGVHF